MSVVFFSKGVEIVVDIIAGVDMVVLSLSVCDFEGVFLHEFTVFTEISRDDGSIGLAIVVLEGSFVEEGSSEEGKHSPADGHGLEIGHSQDSLHAEPETSEPCKRLVSLVSSV